jgi:RNA polymerase sigma factor (TIGR02999 family)
MSEMSEVTRILEAIERGEPKAADQLLPVVYDELRRIAAYKMAGEAAGHTLQPTALVHEAWLRLAGGNAARWQNRAHFFGAAAEAMRRILVEHARRKQSQKRGGGAERQELHESHIILAAPADEVLAVHEALEQLAVEDPQAAELVKLRYFVGMTMEEAATTLGLPKRTAESIWTYARAWLSRALRRGGLTMTSNTDGTD